jgi:peptidyl-dipeptidase Dcp
LEEIVLKNCVADKRRSFSLAIVLLAAGILAIEPAGYGQTPAAFGPSNPFYAASTLPFQAPPFDKIHDEDYQPALEAGMAQQLVEVRAIADNPAAPTFDNTFVALEKSGQLYRRVRGVFNAVVQANTNPGLQRVRTIEAPKEAAHSDAIYLDAKLFHRVETVYKQRASLHLDADSLELVEVVYQVFVHAGAKVPEEKKAELKKVNEEESSLSTAFSNKVLAATKEAAYSTKEKGALDGLSDAQLAAAASAAKNRSQEGYVLPMQNTTRQPVSTDLTVRGTREAVFNKSWSRAEQSDANDTRATIARLAQLRARKAALIGFPTYADWKLDDQMAKTADAAQKFMDALAPASTAKARAEAKEIQTLVDSQKGGFQLQPWDWEFYAEQVRKAKYDLNESEVKPYFELDNVLQNGVFYAATQLYGITFHERHDLPVYQTEVRVFEVREADGKPVALFYCDYFKRDNKAGGAWTSALVGQSRLLGTLPVVYNVANFPHPAPGEPALLTFTDVTTMFHEFGHALHSMLSNSTYLRRTVPRDYVEFPSQFNEHWALYPSVFSHYAKHYKTGEAMPAALAEKIKRSKGFNQGFDLTEELAAAEVDMQWHTLPENASLQKPDDFETAALKSKHMDLNEVPPRYRSSYFLHIWANGYSAGYYAYLWAEMIDDDAFQWFMDHGGLTRANGDRFRQMVLSQGSTVDYGKMYRNWRGADPSIQPLLKDRGLTLSNP